MADKMIWILRPRNDRPNKGDRDADPWSPWYDKCFGMVVRAESEQEAREIADENGGGEMGYGNDTPSIWGNRKLASCIPISEYERDNGRDFIDDRVLIRDVHHA